MDPITSKSEADIRKIFSELAIYDEQDAAVGKRVEEMQKRGMRLETLDGLIFCKECIFNDERVKHVLGSLFPWSGLGIFEVYKKPKQETVYAFMTGKEPFSAVVIQLCSPNSRVVFFPGSQLLPIEGFPLSIGILELLLAPLTQAECKPLPVDMEHGGIIMFDARLAFRIEKGFAIHGVFATRDELRTWPKKQFPKDKGLEAQAKDMENPKMGHNFLF